MKNFIGIRAATGADLDRIMEIVNEARAYFKANGIPQWQGEYPSRADFESDIEGGRLYAAENEERVLGVYCFDLRGDKNYNEIFEGSFRLCEKYGAIHRVAVSSDAKGQGIGGIMVAHACDLAREAGLRYLRGDTHRKNLSMHKMLTKNGFSKCGVIYLDGKKDYENERIAFDMILSGEDER